MKIAKVYSYLDGTEGRRVKPDATHLEFRTVPDDGPYEVLGVVDFSKVEDAAYNCAMRHGVSQRFGDTYAGAKTKGLSADDISEMLGSLTELVEAGTWAVEGEAAGPRISLIFEAIVAAKTAQGAPIDEDAIRANIKKNGVKAALAVPAIRAEYDRIRLERLTAKAGASTKAAADDEGDGLSTF